MSIDAIAKMSHRERVLRRDEKRAEVLKVARCMGWINVAAAVTLLDVTRPAAARTLKGLVADGFLYAHELSGMPRRVWYSLTETGMAESCFLEGDPLPENIRAGRWKIAPQNYPHEQDVLILAVSALKVGADAYLFEQVFSGGNVGRSMSAKYPDLLIGAGGKTYGIEIEREAKSQRRYKDIIASHWLALERHQYDGVLYLSPDQAIRDRVGKVVQSVYERVRIGGRERALNSSEQKRFTFGTYDQGINFIRRINEKEKK